MLTSQPVHLNTNFAGGGPTIQGRKFKKPTVPFSTRGELHDADMCTDCDKKKCECTHMGLPAFVFLINLHHTVNRKNTAGVDCRADNDQLQLECNNAFSPSG